MTGSARGHVLRQRLDRLIEAQLRAAEAELDVPRRSAEPPVAQPVDIVIPIHDGLPELRRCLDSVLACTDGVHRVVLIDDASDDPAVAPWLEQAAATDGRIELRRNASNLGYLATVNAALRASDRDVVLLNSDTEVSPGWLDRLASAACSDGVGMACPVTDQPGPLGVLEPGAATDAGSDDVLQRLRAAAGEGLPRLPVAVGFCVYLRRGMLDAVGLFDPAFAPGYGEENELSMRAWSQGFGVVACPDVLVRHIGGASFGDGAEIRRRQDVHVRLLRSRWPGHDARIRDWWRDWPLRPQAVRLARGRGDERPGIAHVLHRIDRVGGTEIHTAALAQALSPRFRCSLIAPEWLAGQWRDQHREQVGDVELIRWNQEHIRPNQRIFNAGADLSDPGVERRFLRMLSAGHWPIVHVHSLLNWNSLLLPQLARRAGARVVISLHSLESLCADFTLVPRSLGHACGKPYGGADGDCLACLPSRLHRRRGAPATPIDTYLASRRHFWQRALEQADALIAPSRFALERVRAAFDGAALPAAFVLPHGLTRRPAVMPHRPGPAFRAGFLGGCSIVKGIALILRIASDPRLAGIRFEVHGHVDRSVLPDQLPANLQLCGPYRPDLQSALLAGLDVVLLPSQGEETFSLVLSECQAAGVPVIASRSGALPERVRDGIDGWLLPADDAGPWCELLLKLAAQEGRDRLAAVRRHLLDLPQQGIAANADAYAAIYQRLLSKVTTPIAGRRSGSRPVDLASRRLLEQRPARASTLPFRDLLPLPVTPPVRTEWGRETVVLLRAAMHNLDLLEQSRSSLERTGYGGEVVVVRTGDMDGEAAECRHRRLLADPERWCILLDAGDQPLPSLGPVLSSLAGGVEALLADQVLVDGEGRMHGAALACAADPLLSLSLAEPVGGLCVRGRVFSRLDAGKLASAALAYAALLAVQRQGGIVEEAGRTLFLRSDRNLSPGQADACLMEHRREAEAHRKAIDQPGRIIGNGSGFGWRFQPNKPPERSIAIRVWGGPEQTRTAVASLQMDRQNGRQSDIGVLGPDPIPVRCERIILIHASARPSQESWIERLLAWLEISSVAMVAPRRKIPSGSKLACGWQFDGHRLLAVPDPAGVEGCSLNQAADLPSSLPGLSNICLAFRAESVTARDLSELADADLSRSFLSQQRWRASGHLLWTPDVVLDQLAAEPATLEVPSGVARVLAMQGIHAIRSEPAALRAGGNDPPMRRSPDRRARAVHRRTRPRRGAGPEGTDGLRVVALTRDHWAPSRYRVDLPLADLRHSGRIAEPAIWRRSQEPWPSLFEVAELAPSVVIFHDAFDDGALALQDGLARHLPEVRRIVLVDDLITDLPPWHPARSAVDPDIALKLERSLRACGHLVATSHGLADAYGHWSADVRVIENALPERTWTELRATAGSGRPGRSLRVGWVGAQQHRGDLALIDAVVRARPRFDWHFLGMAPDAARDVGASVHPMVPFDDYPRQLAALGLDIALVPLVDHPFNRCKSALKLMELGALGIAVIASDLAPYRDTPVRRVEGGGEAWLQALDEFAGSESLRRKSGAELRAWVMAGNLSGHRRELWLDAFGESS